LIIRIMKFNLVKSDDMKNLFKPCLARRFKSMSFFAGAALSIYSAPVFAQTWVSVASEDFGTGAADPSPNAAAELAPGNTDYSLGPVTVAGNYGVYKNPRTDHPAWQIGADHTGGGYFALFNATRARRGSTIGTYYEYSSGLASFTGATYRVSYWAANLLDYNTPGNPAYIGLEVRTGAGGGGSLLAKDASVDAAPLPRPEGTTGVPWQSRNLVFSVPDYISTNNYYFNFFNSASAAVDDNGNDIGLDDILIEYAITNIGGRIFIDQNANGIFESAMGDLPYSGPALYIIAVDSNDKTISSTPVDSGGYYTNAKVLWTGTSNNQKIRISTAAQIVGGTFSTTNVPAGFTFVSEDAPTGVGSEGVAENDGVISVLSTDGPPAPLQLFNFGLKYQIEASDDSASGIDGVSGAANVFNILGNDSLGASVPTPSQVTVSVTAPAMNPGVTLDTVSGNVSVAAGTPAGTYAIDYRICETLNPTNCATATATITVRPSADLSIVKSNGVSTVTPGSLTTYSITVANAGPDSVAGARVTDVVGAGLTCPAANAVAITGNGIPVGSYTVADLTGAGIALATLQPGQSALLTYSCQVN
jgi:uncharacterized repeat protein (TIGR01451 family)